MKVSRTLHNHKRDWDDLGLLDPLWAIAAVGKTQYGEWSLEDFLVSGDQEIDRVIADLCRLSLSVNYGTCLDFGCGIGRVSQVLSKHFQTCYGVDISEIMIAKANE